MLDALDAPHQRRGVFRAKPSLQAARRRAAPCSWPARAAEGRGHRTARPAPTLDARLVSCSAGVRSTDRDGASWRSTSSRTGRLADARRDTVRLDVAGLRSRGGAAHEAAGMRPTAKARMYVGAC